MSGSNQPLSFVMPSNALDKIFYATPPNISVAVPKNVDPSSPTFTNVPIPQTTGGTMFIDAQVSPDNTNWYDSGYEPYYFDGVFLSYFPRFFMQWHTTTTSIVLQLTANDAAYTLYYRLVAYYKV